MINSKQLVTPFSVTHIDAHSDTGLGDTGYIYIMGELMHYPINNRRKLLDVSKLYMGNYLSYAMACGWIKKIDFVLHEKWNNDFLGAYLKDFDIKSRAFQFKGYPTDFDIGMAYGRILDGMVQPIFVDKDIPFTLTPWKSLGLNEKPDYLIFCQSPSYTPESADYMLEIIKEYIIEI